jgi:hypothetical protein
MIVVFIDKDRFEISFIKEKIIIMGKNRTDLVFENNAP